MVTHYYIYSYVCTVILATAYASMIVPSVYGQNKRALLLPRVPLFCFTFMASSCAPYLPAAAAAA